MLYSRWIGGSLLFFLTLLLVGEEAILAQTVCYREQRHPNTGELIQVRWPIDTVREISFQIDSSVPSERHSAIQFSRDK
jgi:hypothetical protein